jgi:hypothetical protein
MLARGHRRGSGRGHVLGEDRAKQKRVDERVDADASVRGTVGMQDERCREQAPEPAGDEPRDVSPVSGANAAMYTRARTLGLPVAALVITAPP